ncbi:hypothetical protein NDU88_004585, partial [Pleurodeles waltl]
SVQEQEAAAAGRAHSRPETASVPAARSASPREKNTARRSRQRRSARATCAAERDPGPSPRQPAAPMSRCPATLSGHHEPPHTALRARQPAAA